MKLITNLNVSIANIFSKISNDLGLFLARLFVAKIFWDSGQTKRSGFGLSENAVELFKEEYKLPLIDPTFAAWSAMLAENILPVFLIIGLFSRFTALALIIMTLVIQIFVYPSAWALHGLWAVCLILVLKFGAGRYSLDNFLKLDK